MLETHCTDCGHLCLPGAKLCVWCERERDLAAVLENLELADFHRANAARTGITLATRWTARAKADHHFHEAERIAARFFPEPAAMEIGQ